MELPQSAIKNCEDQTTQLPFIQCPSNIAIQIKARFENSSCLSYSSKDYYP